MIRTSALLLLALPFFVACSASDASPGAGNGGGQNGNAGSGGTSAGSGAGNAPSNAAGSGNGLNLAGGPNVGTGGGDVMNGECDRQDFDLARRPAEILIVLDRSGSMKEKPSGSSGDATKWSLVVPGVNEVVTETDASVSWGLKVFPEGEGDECIVGSVTDAIPVAIAAKNAAAVTAQVLATTPEGNGTPTGDAIDSAVAYLKTLSDPNPKFILLATDGEPSCAGTKKGSTGARPYAVRAVEDAAKAGFKTFVVGVATTKTTATQALNDMAVAGEMPRNDPNPLATKYYLASTKDELVQSLTEIAGQVSSCVFDLTSKPPDPGNIAVHVNGANAPKDTTHTDGWDYTSSEYLQVEVYGTWCDQIKAATTNKVNFVLGCPGEVIQ